MGFLGTENLDLSSSWHFDDKVALKLLASKGSNQFYIVGNLPQAPYVFQGMYESTCVTVPGNYSENSEIVQVQMWSNSSTEIRAAMLLFDNLSKTYQLDFSVINVTALANSAYQVTVAPSVHTWQYVVCLCFAELIESLWMTPIGATLQDFKLKFKWQILICNWVSSATEV